MTGLGPAPESEPLPTAQSGGERGSPRPRTCERGEGERCDNESGLGARVGTCCEPKCMEDACDEMACAWPWGPRAAVQGE